MPTDEKKGITDKIDAELHAEVRQFLESHGMTTAEFVTLALQDELHPKLNIQEDKTMGNMRTLAFQVPEELFHKIKDYLQRNNMTQKQFVIGLIESEINRDLAQRAAEAEQRETAAVSEFEGSSEQSEGSNTEEQSENDFEGASDEEAETEDEELDDEEAEDLDDELSEDEESEDEDLGEDESESEDQGMSMRMCIISLAAARIVGIRAKAGLTQVKYHKIIIRNLANFTT